MKKFRLNLILFLAVIFGVAAAFGVYQYLNSVKAAYVEKGDFVTVAVATQYIAPKTQIVEQMFSMREIPAKYVNNNAAVDPKEVAGKLTKTAIYPDEQILKDKITAPGESKEELALIIPAGSRALTVAVNEVSGVAGMIKPGDWVDVLVTFENGQAGKLTSLILQNIKVLATDRNLTDSVGQAEQGKIYQSITVAVTPQQAQPLVLASEQGSIRMMLRPPADKGTVNIPSSKIQDLVR